MKIYKGNTFAQVYYNSLNDLYYHSEYETVPRNLKIKENLQVCLEFNDPVCSLYENETRASRFKYIAAELLWYFLGHNDSNFISKYAPFWNKIQNEDGTINSSYGNLLFTIKNEYGQSQYEWAYNSLVKDKDSRQAIMHFNLPKHQNPESKDFVCTMYGIFHIRENKLNFTIHMRSNDAVLGTPTDIAFFTLVQQQMLNHLISVYPDLVLGKYTHIMDSYHIYEKHFDLVRNMLFNSFTPVKFPTLKYDLINIDGTPLDKLELIKSNSPDIKIESDDLVYYWIKDKIKNEIYV